jgi:hypothetical protein
MAKHPGQHEPIKQMSKEKREARKAFRQVEAEVLMTDHEVAQKAFSDNRERLKAGRVARQANEAPAPKQLAKKAAESKDA